MSTNDFLFLIFIFKKFRKQKVFGYTYFLISSIKIYKSNSHIFKIGFKILILKF